MAGLDNLKNEAAKLLGENVLGSVLPESTEEGVRGLVRNFAEETARKHPDQRSFLENLFIGLGQLPGFKTAGQVAGGLVKAGIKFVPDSILSNKTKQAAIMIVPHILYGLTSGMTDADYEQHVRDTVTKHFGTGGGPDGPVGAYDFVARSAACPGVHKLALDSSGHIMREKEGDDTSPLIVPCSAYQQAKSAWKISHPDSTRQEGPKNNRQTVTVPGVPFPESPPLPFDIGLDMEGGLRCPVCMGDKSQIDTERAKSKTTGSTPVKNFDQASSRLVRVHTAVIRTIARQMRGTTSLAFTSVKYKNLEKFMEAASDPSKIRNVQILEQMAEDIDPAITAEKTVPEQMMVDYIAALDMSGAELSLKQEALSMIMSMFSGEEDDDNVAARRKELIWTWIKRFGLGILAGAVLLILPWLATLAGYAWLAILLALVLGLPLSLFLLPVKAIEAVLDRFTELAANKDFHWGVNYARGIAQAIVLNMMLCVAFNLAGFDLLGRFAAMLAAGFLAFWLFSAKSKERAGVLPILVSLAVFVWCGATVVGDVLRESADYPVTVAWMCQADPPNGKQTNTLVVPLPSGRVEPARDVFGDRVSVFLQGSCELSKQNKDDGKLKARARSEKKTVITFHKCEATSGIVVLPKGTDFNVPGAVVRAANVASNPGEPAKERYYVAETGVNIGPLWDKLPSGKTGYIIFSFIFVILCGIIGFTVYSRKYEDGDHDTDISGRAGMASAGLALLAVLIAGFLIFGMPEFGGKEQAGGKGRVQRVQKKDKKAAAKAALCASWKARGDPRASQCK